MNHLSEDLAVVATIDPQLADDETVSSDYVDMSKFGKVAFVINVGDTDTTVDAKLRESADSTGGSPQDITGKAITQLDSDDDNKQVIIEISDDELSDGYQFVGCDIAVGDGTAGAYVSCVALGGHARYNPANEDDLASVAEIVV